MITSDIYGKLEDGREVRRFTLANKKGEYVQIIEYGAIIHSVVVLDRNGQLGDVVLGCESGERIESFGRSGRVVGRCANRIKRGRFTIGDRKYQLQCNEKKNFLHGAADDYGKKLWTGHIDGESVVLKYYDSDTVGFGCDVAAQVRYSFDDMSRLTIEYEFTAYGDTVLNPTNHVYFDLTETGDIRDHDLWIGASNRATRDSEAIPCGGLTPVKGTPADFTYLRCVRDAINSDDGSYFPMKRNPIYDEFYVLDKQESGKPVADLYAYNKGRGMRTYTDMPSLVLYTDPGKKKETGKGGRELGPYCGICLETGFVPNAVNVPEFTSPVFPMGASLKSTTVYEFYTRDKAL